MPPHDIAGKPFVPHLPSGGGSRLLRELMQASRLILSQEPINQVKVDLGENPASMIWLWGGGTKPRIGSFASKRGVRGAMISAVDLVKGIRGCLGLAVVDVPGATGHYDTDYSAKAAAALGPAETGLRPCPRRAADEAGHHGAPRRCGRSRTST